METFGERLDRILKERDLSPYALEKKTNHQVSRNTVSKWIRDKSDKPTYKSAYLIAQLLNVSVNYLMTGEGTKIENFENPREPIVKNTALPKDIMEERLRKLESDIELQGMFLRNQEKRINDLEEEIKRAISGPQ